MAINYVPAKQQRDLRRVWLDDKDCERLTRPEFDSVRYLLGAISYIAHANDDLGKVLKKVPYGQQRMNMGLGGIRSIVDDIIGMMTQKQCIQLRNTMQDLDMRMVPKLTPWSTNVVFEESIAKELTDLARVSCRECTKNDNEARKCALYRIMEATTPLEDYGDGLLCPYALAEWKDEKEA